MTENRVGQERSTAYNTALHGESAKTARLTRVQKFPRQQAHESLKKFVQNQVNQPYLPACPRDWALGNIPLNQLSLAFQKFESSGDRQPREGGATHDPKKHASASTVNQEQVSSVARPKLKQKQEEKSGADSQSPADACSIKTEEGLEPLQRESRPEAVLQNLAQNAEDTVAQFCFALQHMKTEAEKQIVRDLTKQGKPLTDAVINKISPYLSQTTRRVRIHPEYIKEARTLASQYLQHEQLNFLKEIFQKSPMTRTTQQEQRHILLALQNYLLGEKTYFSEPEKEILDKVKKETGFYFVQASYTDLFSKDIKGKYICLVRESSRKDSCGAAVQPLGLRSLPKAERKLSRSNSTFSERSEVDSESTVDTLNVKKEKRVAPQYLPQAITVQGMPILGKLIKEAESMAVEIALALKYMTNDQKNELVAHAKNGEALNIELLDKIYPNFYKNHKDMSINAALLPDATKLAMQHVQSEQLQIFCSIVKEQCLPEEKQAALIRALGDYFLGKNRIFSQDQKDLLSMIQNKTGFVLMTRPYNATVLKSYVKDEYPCIVRLFQSSEPKSGTLHIKTHLAFPSIQETSSLAEALRDAMHACQINHNLSERDVKVLQNYSAPHVFSKQLVIRNKICADRVSFSDQEALTLQKVLGKQISALSQLLRNPPKNLSERTVQRLREDRLAQHFLVKKISGAPEQFENFKRWGLSQQTGRETILGENNDSQIQKLEAQLYAEIEKPEGMNKSIKTWPSYYRKGGDALPPAHRLYYHGFQDALPFCQTCAINNYLGYGVITPEVATQLSERTYFDQPPECPLIYSSNKQSVLGALCDVLKSKNQSDKEWMSPTLSLLDITQYTWEPPSNAHSHEEVKKIAEIINANPVERVMIDFMIEGDSGHAISLRRKAGDKQWVILDSNCEPFSYTLEELLNNFVTNNKKFTLYLPKDQLTQGVTLSNVLHSADSPFSMQFNYIKDIPLRYNSVSKQMIEPLLTMRAQVDNKQKEDLSESLKLERHNVNRRLEAVKENLHSVLGAKEQKDRLFQKLDALRDCFLSAIDLSQIEQNQDHYSKLQKKVMALLPDLLTIEKELLKNHVIECIDGAAVSKLNEGQKTILKKHLTSAHLNSYDVESYAAKAAFKQATGMDYFYSEIKLPEGAQNGWGSNDQKIWRLCVPQPSMISVFKANETRFHPTEYVTESKEDQQFSEHRSAHSKRSTSADDVNVAQAKASKPLQQESFQTLPHLEKLGKEAESTLFSVCFALQEMGEQEKQALRTFAKQGKLLTEIEINNIAPYLSQKKRSVLFNKKLVEEARTLAFQHLQHEQLKFLTASLQESPMTFTLQERNDIIVALEGYFSEKHTVFSEADKILVEQIKNKTGFNIIKRHYTDVFSKYVEGEYFCLVRATNNSSEDVKILSRTEVNFNAQETSEETSTTASAGSLQRAQDSLLFKPEPETDDEDLWKGLQSSQLSPSPRDLEENDGPSALLLPDKNKNNRPQSLEEVINFTANNFHDTLETPRPPQERVAPIEDFRLKEPLEPQYLKQETFQVVPHLEKVVKEAESTLFSVCFALQEMGEQEKQALRAFAKQGRALTDEEIQNIAPDLPQQSRRVTGASALVKEARTLAFQHLQHEQLRFLKTALQEATLKTITQQECHDIILALQACFLGERNFLPSEIEILEKIKKETGFKIIKRHYTDHFSKYVEGEYLCLVRATHTNNPTAVYPNP